MNFNVKKFFYEIVLIILLETTTSNKNQNRIDFYVTQFYEEILYNEYKVSIFIKTHFDALKAIFL